MFTDNIRIMNLSIMNYFIEKLGSFQILAHCRDFHSENSMTEIPKFWSEYYRRGYGEIACGQYGVCFDSKPDGTFSYAIGNQCHVEHCKDGSEVYHIFNGSDRKSIPEGFRLLTIPASTWIKVECLGPLPESIQNTYPIIQKEWPRAYKQVPGTEIEEYGFCSCPEDCQKPDYQCFIWVQAAPAEDLSTKYTIKLNNLSAEDFNRIGKSVGWQMPQISQSELALKNSLAVFSVYSGDTLIGMGRLIGDSAMAYTLREIAVIPEAQHKGAGTFLINSMLKWIADDVPYGWKASCELFAAKGQSNFYQHCGFHGLPFADNENGMSQMVTGTKSLELAPEALPGMG